MPGNVSTELFFCFLYLFLLSLVVVSVVSVVSVVIYCSGGLYCREKSYLFLLMVGGTGCGGWGARVGYRLGCSCLVITIVLN